MPKALYLLAVVAIGLILSFGVFLNHDAEAAPAGSWNTDFAEAQRQARDEDKDLLLNFTGSDWCGFCIELEDAVFTRKAFVDLARNEFVLVEVDFPAKKPQSDAVKQQNAELKQRYGVAGYPTVLLIDSEGNPYAQTGYLEGGPDEYLEHLGELRQNKGKRDDALAAAESATGSEKASHLDEAMAAVGMDLAVTYYLDTVREIVQLDASDQSGLKSKYQTAIRNTEINRGVQMAIAALQAQQVEQGMAQLDQILRMDSLSSQQIQMINGIRGQVLQQLGRIEEARAAYQAALQADPQSPVAPQILQLIQQLEQ